MNTHWNRRFRRLGPTLLLALLWVPAAAQEPADGTDPREIGLVERTSRKLGQLDVTVRGPEKKITTLEAQDFELVVHGRFIRDFIVDPICDLAPAPPPATEAASEEQPAQPPPVRAPRRPVSYLFYFDHQNLTMYGRRNALDIARELVRELVADGNRGSLVSTAAEPRTFVEMTADPEELLRGLDRIENDNTQFDPYPSQEENRLAEVVKELQRGTSEAQGLARRYQREERFRTEKALRIFSTVLTSMADLDPPKAAIYFADTMRSNAGEHYLSLFGQAVNNAALDSMATDSFTAKNPFDRLVEEASANGVRLYTIQAEGLTTGDSSLIGSRGRIQTGQDPVASRRRVTDAKNSLVGLARETGGQAFIDGVRTSKIARTIATDLSCVYLLSFDVTGLPEDEPLRAIVRMKRPGVDAQVRGQFVVQSASTAKTARLLAAFASDRANSGDARVRAVVVPTGFADGKFTGLVQIAVPGSPLARAEWDIGASLVARGRLREDTAGRVEVGQPGVPVVYEAMMEFPPGPWELIVVAHEATTGRIASRRVEGEMPDPREAGATVTPFALMQPAAGAFQREGRESAKTRGALTRDDEDLARTELPSALIGLICRKRGARSAVDVERSLSGEGAVDFPTLRLELGEDRCAQVRDLIPAGTMTAGSFVYEVRVLDGQQELATRRLTFSAVSETGDLQPPGEPAARR